MEGGEKTGKEKEQLADLPTEANSARTRKWLEESSGSQSQDAQEERRQSETVNKGVRGRREERKKEEAGKRGRPRKAESLKRERNNSASSTISLASWFTKRVRESDTESSEEEKEGQRKKKKCEKREIVTTTITENTPAEKEKMDFQKLEEMMKKIVETAKKETIKKIEEGQLEIKKELEKYKAEAEKRDEERKKEINELRREITEMKRREEERERREKKRNIVIWGTQGKEGEAKQIAVDVFKKIDIEYGEVGIREARFIGKRENRGLVVEIEKFEDKKKIMVGKNKLRGSTFFLDDDMTKTEREMQKKIRDWAKVLRERGKRVNVGYGKGYVNGIEFRWNTERGRMEETFREDRME